MKLTLTLHVAPRTLKNHGVRNKYTGASLPSKAYQEWARLILDQKTRVANIGGGKLPFRELVTVKALFYRDRNSGDATGYYQALGDIIQTPTWKCQRPKTIPPKCNKISVGERPPRCPFCDFPMLRRNRDGLGIILDDAQIANWDGSNHLLVDRERPRVELVIETIAGAQLPLIDPDEEAEEDAD